jgi:hypothetical protein
MASLVFDVCAPENAPTTRTRNTQADASKMKRFMPEDFPLAFISEDDLTFSPVRGELVELPELYPKDS